MRKEVFFAILAGTIFGLVVAFGIWRANSSIKPKGDISEATPTASTPTPAVTEVGLTIAKPDSNSVFAENPVTLSGITKPDAWIAISSEEKDYVVKADTKGAFEQDIDLVGGVNEIIVTSFDDSGSSNTQKFLLVFSSEFK